MIILGVLLFSVSGAWGQGITFEGKPRWGFNNTVVLQRINRLSVLVANNTGEAFDGTITLQKEDFSGSRLGARLVQPVYLSPFTQRWVHFLCYVANEHEQWKLRIGRGLLPSTYLAVERAKAGPPVRMFLREAGSVVGRRSRMQSFADDEFPTSLTGLDTLHSLVLAHAPEWEPSRKQALRDWVYRGGTLHIFQDSQGRFPIFVGTEWSFLNQDSGASSVGAGQVVYHAKPGHTASDNDLDKQGYPVPRVNNNNSGNFYGTVEQTILLHLRRLVLPEHKWGFMFFVAMIYLVLIGPLNYVFARRWVNHFLSLGAFLACVLVFGLIFMLLGRRGFGESSGISYLGYVQPLDANRSDLTQWINVFSTKGKTVDFTHSGTHRVFSTCQESEAVPGTIVNGVKGLFQVEMPIFSSMSFLVRTVVDGPDLACSAEGDVTTGIDTMRFRVGTDLPQDIQLARLVYQDRVYSLKREDAFFVIDDAKGDRSVKQLIDPVMRKRISQLGQADAFTIRRVKKENKGLNLGEKHEPVFYMLMERVLGANKIFHQQVEVSGLPANLARLFILTQSPGAFNLRSSSFKEQYGMMILHQDILL
jgi:hypothetical protein